MMVGVRGVFEPILAARLGRSRVYRQVQAKLLRGSRWEGQEISQYLRRIEGAEPTRQRVGGVHGRGVLFNLDRFLTMFSGDTEQDAESAAALSAAELF